MKKNRALSLAGTGLFWLAMVGVAFANNGHHHHHGPEIDPGSVGSGLTFLAGSALMVIEKFRRRRG